MTPRPTLLDEFGRPIRNEQPGAEGIELATREDNHIDNNQCTDRLGPVDIHEMEDLEARYTVIRRGPPIVIYNCHGLVFACRRAEINEPNDIKRILREDRYEQVAAEDALPGDIIVYYYENGDAEHSGIVIEEAGETYQPPMIVSKWGKGPEYIHSANQCPYNFSRAKYYRVQS